YQLTKAIPAHESAIGNIVFDSSGRFMATSSGREIKVWDVAKMESASTRQVRDIVAHLTWSPTQELMGFGGYNGMVGILPVEPTASPKYFKDQETLWVLGAAFSHDGSRFVSASKKSVVAWNVADEKAASVAFHGNNTIKRAKFMGKQS